ncbi:MAG: hypothetical protein RI897_1040 [Verrucomicrobiota bacterium]
MNSKQPVPIPSFPTWRTAGGDAQRSGRARCRLVSSPAAPRSIQVNAPSKSSVLFASSGTAYLADARGGVHAFNAERRPAWKARLSAGTVTTPALASDDSRLYVGTLQGHACALDASSGDLLWETEIQTTSDPRILSAILPLDDSILVSSWGGRWTRLSSGDGSVMASWDAGIYPQSAAAASADGNIYILRAVWEKGIELVRLSQDGSEHVLHVEEAGSRGPRRMMTAASPVVDASNDLLFAVLNHDTDSVLAVQDLKGGSAIRTSSLPACVQATPTLGPNGSLRIADLAGNLHALGPEGQIEWTYRTGSEYLLASPVVDANGTAWLGDPLGQIHEIDANGWGYIHHTTARSIEAQPSVSPTGELVIATSDGNILFFG